MVRAEMYKLFRMKIAILPVFVVLGVVVYSLFHFGEFGYDLSDSITAYSEMDGKMILGQKGYEHNKKIAKIYKGEITDCLLEKINNDYQQSTYVNLNGIKFYNGTFRFFHDVFNIGEEHYLGCDEVWGKHAGKIEYGFAGDWDAYISIIDNFFHVFSLFILVFAAPLFTYEKECDMAEMIGTVRYGGNLLYKYKMQAVFIVVNFFLVAVLGFISILHFSRYGLINGDVSIQCSMDKTLVSSVISCSMAEFAVYKLVFGIVGCNMVLLLTVLSSILSVRSLAALGAAFISVWIFHYSVVHGLVKNNALDILLAILPVNALEVETLMKAISSKEILYVLLIIQITLLIGGILLIKKIWGTKRFYK